MIAALCAVDHFARGCVAWPLALLGIALCSISGWCIRSAAWLADVDWDELEDE